MATVFTYTAVITNEKLWLIKFLFKNIGNLVYPWLLSKLDMTIFLMFMLLLNYWIDIVTTGTKFIAASIVVNEFIKHENMFLSLIIYYPWDYWSSETKYYKNRIPSNFEKLYLANELTRNNNLNVRIYKKI